MINCGFNPRPPGGGRLVVVDFAVGGEVSIHALRVEGDAAYNFAIDHGFVSIHALRVEGDLTLYI